MKLNGKKNIITDRDVTITGDKNLGDSLHSIIAKHQTDLDQLKSNVKWLFKYGGVGSGAGASSVPGKWSIVATLDGKTISGNKISLNKDISSYVLDIRISGASTSYYVEYSYGNISRSVSLSADNGWRFKQNIDLTANGHITITVSDGSLIKTVEADYITAPYILSKNILLLKNNGDEWPSSSGDIFMQTAVVEGLVLGCSYSFAINAEVKYLWEFNNDVIEGKLEDLSGVLTFPINSALLEDPVNAGLYSSKLLFYITPEGQTEITEEIVKSFNLIPNELFLKILPSGNGEQIYNSEQETDFYQYSINKNIGFYCRAYKGSNNNSACSISYSTLGSSGEITSGTLEGVEGQTYLINMRFETAGWHKLTFTCTMESETRSFIKYLYCYQSVSNYTWYKLLNNKLASSKGTIAFSNYYRVVSSNISENFGMTAPITMTVNSEEQIIKIPERISSVDVGELAINIGIQYNNINNIKNPILGISTIQTKDSVKIFQNSVTLREPFISEASQSWFVPKTFNYDSGVPENYHLLSFVLTNASYDNADNKQYYQCCLYVDGVLDGAFKTFMTGSNWINEVILYPGNYSINLLDITYFESPNKNIPSINDVDINYYYKTYYSVNNNIPIASESSEILDCFYDNSAGGSTYSIVNNLIQVNSTLYDNIAMNTKIPTLVLKRDMSITEIEDGGSVIDWLNSTSYKPEETSGPSKWKVPVQLKWSKGGSTTSDIVIDKKLGGNTSFYIELQGTSTLSNKSKNLTLGIKSDESLGSTVVFSPNYSADNNKTFLPEQMFTLKADVVDSSHSNNTAIGEFINRNNDCNDAFSNAQPDNVKQEIRNHVKQCLEGFPVLLYLELTDSTGIKSPEYYYLGVYNFNLGRESYFNLGYCDLTQLNNIEDSGDLFMFTTVKSLDPLDNFIAAEIQGNNKFWDFSQYDASILFPLPNENSGFMFGDFVRNSNNDDYQNSIQNFVKSVAHCGGYLFNSIGKTFEDVNKDSSDRYCYHEVNVVPNVLTQYKRTSTVSGSTYEGHLEEGVDINSYDNLVNCITSIDDAGTIKPPYLDYKSAVYYYTTCMVFGLVDSVQKNLNIKTWNGKTFGIYFYDMDTSLGTSNSGGDTSYFCFSDYWDNKTEEKEDEYGNIETLLKGISINRDYYPLNHEGIIGYDVPSSYLFAISKYVASIIQDESLKKISPQQIYATWRKLGGVLENADKFIDTYYSSTLRDVPPELINLNYRNKFLYNLSGTTFSGEQSGLKGTKIEKTRNWLNGRLHILDAYFNLGNIPTRLSDSNDIYYIEPQHSVSNLAENKDIYILKDIFVSPTETRVWTREGSCTFKVSGEEYAPLIITKGETTNRYLLVNPNTVYTIEEKFSGQQTANFGGSDLWTYVETINPFIDTLTLKNNFYLNSEKINRIYGDSNFKMSNWEFVTPSATDIILTGKNYEGSLKINSSFYNLTNVDISNSKISLEIDGTKVKTVNLNNINSSVVTLANCDKLEKVNLNNAVIMRADIRPAWTHDIDLSNTKITELTIQGKETNGEFGTLIIKNSSSLQKLTFKGFKNVEIINATNLNNVECNDDTDVLQSLQITSSPKLTDLVVPGNILHTLNVTECLQLRKITYKGKQFDQLKRLDLSYTGVEYIEFVDCIEQTDTTILDLSKFKNLAKTISNDNYVKLRNNSNVQFIQFDNNEASPVILNYPIRDCSNLQRVYGNIKINCTYCFYNNRKFSIHGSVLSDVRWQNQSILDNGRVKLPSEVFGSGEFSDTLIFQKDQNVTNLSLNTTNAASLFAYTNCTIFDYYYFFSVCTNVVNCSSTFGWTQNPEGVFQWNSNVDNSPNRHMFDRCTNISKLDNCFRQNIVQSPSIRIFTPTNRNVISEDGLFTKLVNLTTLTYAFDDYKIYTDRFIFRKNEGDFNIEHITGLPVYLYVDDINGLSYNGILLDLNNSSTFMEAGKLSNIFNNLNNVKYLFNFPNTTYINYDESQFTLPKSLQIMGNSFVSVYGKGEMKFSDYTVNCKQNLRIINSSFRVTKNLSILDMVFKVQLKLTNTTFENLSALEWIGFGRPEDENWNANYTTSNYTESSFNGDGIEKIIDKEFPYSIFTNSGSKNIKQLSSIFMNATPENQYVNPPKLPGDMFDGLSALEQTTALFFDINTPYNLSNSEEFTNFAACQNLKDVSYMFGQSTYDDKGMQKEPMLFGPIPKKFFRHGDNAQIVTIIGADNVIHEYDDNNQIISTDVKGDKTITFEYKQPRATITNMEYCFTRCNCDAYVNDIENDVEPNPNYSPKAWIFNNGKWEKNPNIDSNEYTGIWYYDGNPEHRANGEQLDETDWDEPHIVIKEDTDASFAEKSKNDADSSRSLHYIAPPDLLRYCTPSANIKGLFAYSGVRGWNQQWNNADTHKYGYGIKGRICPYMLKPVSNTTNLDYLFASCKLISYVEDSNQKAYFIPKEFFKYAPKVNSLIGFFNDMLLPQNIDLNVFNYLTSLNITDMFYQCYWDGTETNYVQLNEIFRKVDVFATTRAFCIYPDDTSSIDRIRSQYIKFSNIFKNKYASSTYENNMNYAYTFAGYDNTVIHEDPKTLPDNNKTYNYLINK